MEKDALYRIEALEKRVAELESGKSTDQEQNRVMRRLAESIEKLGLAISQINRGWEVGN